MSNAKKSGARQTLEGSVTCCHCSHEFCSVVNFNVNGKLDFQLELFKNSYDQSSFVNLRFINTEQDYLEQKYSVKCPDCKKKFELSICFNVTIDESHFKCNLSITTCEADKEKNETKSKAVISEKRHPLPVLRRVKVFYKCSGETFHSDEQIKEQLMPDKWQTLHIQETNMEDSDIVIVFCPITSRVGSDVESSMTDKTVSSLQKPIILVLMHHTRDVDYSTAGTIWSEVYPNVVLDVHVLFHETKPGLLRCRQNEEAFKIIQKELNKYSKSAFGMLTNY